MRNLLLASSAIAVVGLAWVAMPSLATSVVNGASSAVCSVIPDQCLEWRRASLEATRETLVGHRGRIQEGVRTVEAHATYLRQQMDAIRANSQLLAQREMDRRNRNAPSLEFAGRTYTPADVEAQARLWAAELTQAETTLGQDIAARRVQFAEARERVSLAYARVDSVVQMMTADLLLAPALRDLAKMRSLSAAADAATREARELLDPVRSVLELPPLAGAPTARRAPERPAFDMDGWLRSQGRPQS